MKKWLAYIGQTVNRPQVRRILVACGVVFIMANVMVWLVFSQRTYPSTTVNKRQLGSVKFSELPDRLNRIQILSAELELTYNNKVAKVKPNEAGFTLNAADTTKQIKRKRSWLPMLNLFKSQDSSIQISVNEQQYHTMFTGLSQEFKQEPGSARIVLNEGVFTLQPESNGYRLEESAVKDEIVKQLSLSHSQVVLPVESVQPSVKQESLKEALALLEKQTSTSMTFRYQAKSKKLSAKDVSAFYVASNATYVLSDVAIKTNLTNIASSFGITAQNITEAVGAVKQALNTSAALDFTFVPMPVTKTYTYCVQLRNVDASHRGVLEAKLRAVYADARGWNLGGAVSYVQANSGCSFTVWLSAADQMPTFGAICDVNWSCRVGANVVLNFDRWQGASSAWNASGGSLDDYRSMVINHETGHWLGFGHSNCPGTGQPAPVMQQQSINLQGCRFNPWPTAGEQAALRVRL
jgi:hypothetical protein